MSNVMRKKKFTLVATVIVISCGACWAKIDISNTYIKSERTTIEISEPLVIQVVRKYHNTDDVIKRPFEHTMNIAVENLENGEFSIHRVWPENICKDLETDKFVCTLTLWYDSRRENFLQPIFATPGKYKIYLQSYPSSELNVKVIEASAKTKKAIRLLEDPNDIVFLLGNRDCKNKDVRMNKLVAVVAQCEGTLIGQIAAAHLGLEYAAEFHKKHPSNVKFKKTKKEEQIQEPLFDKAHVYLTKGTDLPDNIPLREEVLHELAIMEYINDDFDKADLTLDELATKYSRGKHGKKAEKAKKELEQLKIKENK